ncbi:MAG: alpha/beta hydrolase [Treponema sp.]|nr:alpha/beta hydrolase [Treponema sp.]
MQTERFMQKMSDGTEIAVNRWIPEDEEGIKGVVVFSHGMLEHALRYDRIGSVFAEKGFVFSAHDHRGHGRTALTAEQNGTGCFGMLSEKDGYKKVTSDLAEIIDEIKNDYPGKKIILLGHSFGSFVAQDYIEQHGDLIDGCILMGSSGKQKLAGFGVAVTGIACLFGKRRKLKFIQNIAFTGYNSHVKGKKHSFSWLCASEDNLKLYENDSWCGGVETVSFFNDMSKLLCKIHKAKNIAKIPSGLPVLFAAGTDDPVGEYGHSIEKLINQYIRNGVGSVQFNQYEGDRHELFNENDSDKVLEDLFDWIEKITSL